MWKQAGWRKLGLPQLPNHMWVHDSAYFAPWCPTAPWLNPSVHLSTAPASLLAIAVAGRDYFFYNEDVERYLLTFGNRPDSVGLSAARSGGSATSGRVRSNPAWQTHSKRTSSSSSSSGDSIRSLTPAQLQEYWISNGFIFPLDLSLDALLDEDSEDRQISLWDSRTENDIARMFFYVRIRRFKAKANGKFDSRDGLCVCVKLTGPSAPLWGIFFTSDSAVGQHEELGLNDLYRAAADFQNGALQPEPVVKIAVASKDCQTDPVEFAKTDELDEKIHQLEKDLAIKDQQILIWKDRYSSMANRGNQEREELRATNSDMKNEIKDKQSQISKLRDSINGYKDSDKRLRERCEALEEERDASRQRSKSKYEADIRRVREEERKRIMFQAASSSNAIVPAFIPSAPVSAEVSVGDAVKSWVSFQEGLKGKQIINYCRNYYD